MPKKIITYNVNGIRAAIKKGLTEWIAENDYDIICFQETKAHQDQVNVKPFEEMGYQIDWHAAERKGYSGVATFSKVAPQKVTIGCGIDKYDQEGRILRTDYKDFSILNCYFPSGTTGDVRQDFKMEFLADFFEWIKGVKDSCPNLIVVGDYNIAHTEMDLHDPKSNKKTSGFLPEERAWLSSWFDSGFVDAFRYKHPEKVEYSWWSYRARARERNKGWRLDYQSVANPMKNRILDAYQLTDIVHSDHCPVMLSLED